MTKCYNIALSILEDDIFEVIPDVTGVIPRDLLLYFYYGGMIYTGLKQFPKALEFFKTVISAPAAVLSAVVVEAYKKFVLLHLLVLGKTPVIPRHANMIQRFHKTAFLQYNELVAAYVSGNTDELHKVAEQHAEVFQKDRNFGLVKQCVQSLYRRNIQKFTQTYLTFSLQDIATGVKLGSAKEAEKQVLRMIEKGEIFATINQKNGMVSFLENPEQYDTNNMLGSLDFSLQKVIDIGRRSRALDENIGANPSYVQKTLSERGKFTDFDGPEGPEGMMSSDKGAVGNTRASFV